MAVRAAGIAESVVDNTGLAAVAVVDTAAVVVADTVVVVVAAALASLAASRSYRRTLHQRLPERHTEGIDTTAASQHSSPLILRRTRDPLHLAVNGL